LFYLAILFSEARDSITDVFSSTVDSFMDFSDSRSSCALGIGERANDSECAINVATRGRRGVCIYRSPRRQLGMVKRVEKGRLLIMPLPRRKLQRLAIRFFSLGPREASVSSARARARGHGNCFIRYFIGEWPVSPNADISDAESQSD